MRDCSSFSFQGSCVRVSPESGGTEGPQHCPVALERPTHQGVSGVVREDEEWSVC